MFGSYFVKMINDHWSHVGYLTSEEVVIPPSLNAYQPFVVPTTPKGTWMMADPADETKMQLASGSSGPALGFTTQDLTTAGQTDVNAFHDRIIGKQDLPVKLGRAVSLRRPHNGAEIEFEGHGVAGDGTLVVTSGTGALAANTARDTRLSFFKGAIRIAQTGDWAQLILLQSGLPLQNPQDSAGLRIRVRMTDPVQVEAANQGDLN